MSINSKDRKNVLIIVTGSVATIKLPLLVEKLLQKKTSNEPLLNIRIIPTESSLHFFCLADIDKLLPPGSIIRDADEWSEWKMIGDPVLHIELRNWAHLAVIAPLDANTLGKISNGLCDNLATCVIRAWDTAKPLLFCPAMNVHMWEHPMTKKGLEVLTDQLGYLQIGPISKKLACGDIGMGAMSEVDQIAQKIYEILKLDPV